MKHISDDEGTLIRLGPPLVGCHLAADELPSLLDPPATLPPTGLTIRQVERLVDQREIG
jgi:hypothetical protein